MASFKKQRRISSFICLIMGLLILVSMFLPIFNLESKVGDESKTIYSATPYDMLKAVLVSENVLNNLLPENIEVEIYKIINKIDKDAVLVTDGNIHASIYELSVAESKLYAYFAYYGAIIAIAVGALMVIFGLLGTLFRSKVLKLINIITSLLALIGGGLSIVGSMLLGEFKLLSIVLFSVSFPYWTLLIAGAALISLIGFMVFRPKRKRL